MAEAIRTEELSKAYNGFRALDALNLQIETGHCVGFLGPNGAGKTTTIKILTHLLQPSSGRAFLLGLDIAHGPREAMANVGAVVETPEFYPELTPRETLTFMGRLRGMTAGEIDRRTEEVLALVKMADWVDKRMGTFSKGMKQRVAIAQALLHSPTLLILDEPTSGLDPRGVAEVRDVIRGLRDEGLTIFMSSHLMYEVQEICDRVALINRGRLIAYDEVGRLAALRTGGEVEVEALQPIPAEVASRVASLDGILSVRPLSGNRLVVEVEGGPEVRAALLAALMAWGVRITSFRDMGLPLEALYLDLIKESR